ncbi:MAG: hypothetical protein Q9226_004139, partial [Calogaya cf. arnoldii]
PVFDGIVMSGTNPFRRKEAPAAGQRPNALEAGADALHQAGVRFPPIDTGVQKSTKTKTVRIVSPHYSRNKDDYGITGIISPPRPTDANSPSSTEESSPIDPFSVVSDEGTSQDDDDDLRRNTIANTAPIMPQNLTNMRIPLKYSKKAPKLQFGGDSSTLGSYDGSDRAASTTDAGRPLYDVDDFKRLLLTGKKLQTDRNMPITPSAQVYPLQTGDSNSSSVVSSFSGHSVSEAQPEVQPESPSTPMDVFQSGEERRGLVQPSPAPTIARNRPSVPPSRHGKLVKSNVAQAVSFESSSSSSPDRDTALPSSSASSGNTTHLNKPLPPPPKPGSPIPFVALPVISATRVEEIETNLPLSEHSNQANAKPSPPTIPTARRHGQGRSRSSTNDSNQSISLSEDHSQHTLPSSSSSSTTASKPPPLPPPRRAGTAPGLDNTGPFPNLEPSFAATESPHFKPRPPAPPSRTPSTTSIRRTSRISIASGSSGAGVAPAPPAPRRRGSNQSQSSFTPSRLSGEYRVSSNERPRADSGASSTQEAAMSETHAEGKDLVGDLTALQKEVDELRGKFGR